MGGKTVEECKQLCMEETSFKCISIDYYKTSASASCHLSAESSKTQSSSMKVSTRVDYYELSPSCQPEQEQDDEEEEKEEEKAEEKAEEEEQQQQQQQHV